MQVLQAVLNLGHRVTQQVVEPLEAGMSFPPFAEFSEGKAVVLRFADSQVLF